MMWNGKNRVHLAASKNKKGGILCVKPDTKGQMCLLKHGRATSYVHKRAESGQQTLLLKQRQGFGECPCGKEVTAEAETI